GRGCRVALLVAGAQEVHVPRAHEEGITGCHRHARLGNRALEVVAGDRVCVVEVLDTVQPRDVDQHTARRYRAEVFDTQPRRTAVGRDHVGGRVVVELPLVPDVRKRVPVGCGLRTHAERVVTCGEVAR